MIYLIFYQWPLISSSVMIREGALGTPNIALKITFFSEYEASFFCFFFLLARGVQASLRVPRLFLTAHWTLCKSSEQVKHHGSDRRTQRESNSGRQKKTSLHIPLEHDPQAWVWRLLLLLLMSFISYSSTLPVVAKS